MPILYLLASALTVLAIVVLAWWIAQLITRNETWQAVAFILIAFVLIVATFVVLYELTVFDPILRIMREEI